MVYDLGIGEGNSLLQEFRDLLVRVEIEMLVGNAGKVHD
jgi:hypothetical protein